MVYVMNVPDQSTTQWSSDWSEIVESDKADGVDCGPYEIIWEWDENQNGIFEQIPDSTVFRND